MFQKTAYRCDIYHREAEYISDSIGVGECLWVKDLLSELNLAPHNDPLSLTVEDKAEIKNMESSINYLQQEHFVRDNVQAKRVTVE